MGPVLVGKKKLCRKNRVNRSVIYGLEFESNDFTCNRLFISRWWEDMQMSLLEANRAAVHTQSNHSIEQLDTYGMFVRIWLWHHLMRWDLDLSGDTHALHNYIISASGVQHSEKQGNTWLSNEATVCQRRDSLIQFIGSNHASALPLPTRPSHWIYGWNVEVRWTGNLSLPTDSTPPRIDGRVGGAKQ